MSAGDDMRDKVTAYADDKNTDFIVYFGDISRYGSDLLSAQCAGHKLRKNVILLLATYGGDANAAYRISRCLQDRYNTLPPKEGALPGGGAKKDEKRGSFTVCVDGICKSAGTILCLGADRLIMSDAAELGPIDAQLRKQDEVGERTSGLTPIQAIQFLETQSVRLFKRHFHELHGSPDLGFSTKMSATIATEMTVGLLTAVYDQIDPIRLAEVDRSLKIAGDYGERLAHGNLKDDAIEKLLAKYPSHGFVIDRREAGELFATVESPDARLVEFLDYFRSLGEWILARDDTFVIIVSREPKPPEPAAPETPPQPAG